MEQLYQILVSLITFVRMEDTGFDTIDSSSTQTEKGALMKRAIEVPTQVEEHEGLCYDPVRATFEGLYEEMKLFRINHSTLDPPKSELRVTSELFEALLDVTELSVNVGPDDHVVLALQLEYAYYYGRPDDLVNDSIPAPTQAFEVVEYDPYDPDTFPSVCPTAGDVYDRFKFVGGEKLVFTNKGEYLGQLVKSLG